MRHAITKSPASQTIMSIRIHSVLSRLVVPGVLALTSALSSVLGADTTWQGDALTDQWNDSANWTGGVPDSTANVILPDVPSGQLQIAGSDAAAGSLLVQAGSSAFTLGSAAAETLDLYGNFTNGSVGTVSVAAYVSLKNSVMLSGVGGLLDFSLTTEAALTHTTLAGTVALGGTLRLGLDSVASYGNFTLSPGSSVDLTFLTTLAFSPSTYTGVLNDTFQLFNVSVGSWTGASAFAIDTNSLPTLTGGLTWTLSNFETDGSISVVPEPGTASLLLLAGIACWIFSRRSRIS